MKDHICAKERTGCRCWPIALEPNEDCPVHGWPWPPKCGECGRFLKWPEPPTPGEGADAEMITKLKEHRAHVVATLTRAEA